MARKAVLAKQFFRGERMAGINSCVAAAMMTTGAGF